MEEILSFKIRGFLKGNTTNLEVIFPNGLPSIAIILQSIVTLLLVGILLFEGIWIHSHFRQNGQQHQYAARRSFTSFDLPLPKKSSATMIMSLDRPEWSPLVPENAAQVQAQLNKAWP
jgi:hypothetical protein